MTICRELDPSAATRVLAEASERSQSLDLVRMLEAGQDACRSRFVQAPGGLLTIEVPSRRGHLVPMRSGESVEVFFRLGHQRYWFASTVRERSTVLLSDTLELPSLVLERPVRVELRQRRRHFRAHVQSTQLMATLWHVAADGNAQGPALPPMEVLDLSAGGARLLCKGGKVGLLRDGQRVSLSLPLEAGRPPVVVQATVTRRAQVDEKSVQLGLGFVDLDETPDCRRAQDRIQRFVSACEREEVRRSRGLA